MDYQELEERHSFQQRTLIRISDVIPPLSEQNLRQSIVLLLEIHCGPSG